METLPETTITDVSFSQTIREYDLTLKIKKLFDREYVMIQHYPKPKRNFEISLINQCNKGITHETITRINLHHFFNLVSCEDNNTNEEVLAEFGSISGTVNFSGSWPDSGEVLIH
ncbi:hypothetical protein Ct9H90mP29_14130 [bacterium]|nr:MAG: hypothetical protein Ct9H90mP29_14130 [bacterium]